MKQPQPTMARRLSEWIRRHWLASSLIPGALALSFVAFGQATGPAAYKTVDLSSEPLYAVGGTQKPTLSLALSVEYPTVGAQYAAPTPGGTEDNTYTNTREYLGYFDADSCYVYNNDADPNLRRFDRSGAATAHGCGGTGFSGNFMNWASSSAIDVLRLGLTGGDRIVDTSSLTVLQRAVLASSKGDFYNGSNFPAKRLLAAYVGNAVPTSLVGGWNGDVVVANCLNRIHFGTSIEGNCNNPRNNANLGVAGGSHGTQPLSSDRFFYSRVQVCESTDPRAAYCVKYPNGNHKPTGNLQKYSDRLRISAFGYLMDDDIGRYGGVLRAPMKFVGPKTYDDSGALQTATNPKVEWDLNTGVFITDPEGSTAEGKSGVINYLNQFGRTGATAGNYKIYDPVGELYYETLRYVQGLPPTPLATAGLTDAMKDGFPVYSAWTDPHAGGVSTRDYSCLKNNIVVIGDVNTHYDKYIPGNTTNTDGNDPARAANLSGNEPNFYDWTNVVGSFEANATTGYLDGKARAQVTSNPNAGGTPQAPRNFGTLAANTYSNRAGYFMAGMAYWANTHDIRGSNWTAAPTSQRPGMRATTYVLDVNEYGDNSVLNNRHNSPFYLTGKYGGFRDKSDIGNPYLSATGTLDNSSWEAEGNPGEPSNYFLSSSARAVLTAIDNMFAAIAAQGGSIGGGAISTQQLTSAGSFIYQAQFDPANWSGDVISYPVSVSSGNVVSVGSAVTKQWSAATQLDAATPAARNIVVGNVNRSGAAASVFQWGSIETGAANNLQALLDRASPTASADGLGQQRLDFIRGDRSLEGTTFRRRGSRLGDIVNSGVVYSGVPTTQISDTGYSAFFTANAGRTKALFVGANDGMLHGFNADTGSELFAYIPSWMGPRLSSLTNTTYNTSLHQSYVDSTPAVAEALVGSAWKTVLVGGTGAGGQGVYALDVTDPTAFGVNKVMWEFTDRDDADMGNVIGHPQILKFRTSASTATTPTYKYFAVVASGVNNTANDGFISSTGNPAIFLLDLAKTSSSAWVQGSNYYKISVPVNSTQAAATAPGVAEFTATGGLAGEVAAIYFGDLHGNLWKLDFSTLAASAWNMASLSAFKSGGTPIPFYIAKDSTGVVQPITMQPTLLFGPNNSKIISFGTGKYLESSDNAVSGATQRQSLYTLYDNNSTTIDTGAGASAIQGRTRLAAATAATGTITVPSFAYGRPLTDGDSTQRSGWYVDFPNTAERQVSAASPFGNFLVFATLQPPAATTDACAGGSSFQYALDLGTGTGEYQASTVGVLGQPFVLQVGDTNFTTSDSAGRRVTTSTGQVILQGSTGIKSETSSQLTTVSTTGRLSWRRISNYQQLKNAP